MRLSQRSINALAYTRKSGAQCHWDSDLSGLGVRIYPSGRKSYVVSYRAAGRQRSMTLGKVGVLTPNDARGMALEVLVAVAKGGDPAADRAAYRQAPTVADLRNRYMKEHAEIRKKRMGVGNDERMWRLHILSAIGRRKVTDVSRAEIVRLHTSMAETPYQANRMLALLSKAFQLAELWEWRTDGTNPCKQIQRYREEKRERYLSSDEFTRLADVLAQVEHERTERPASIAAIRLLMLTGCRSGEIKTLRWSEVDTERRCLRLADSKTGRRTVYLNTAALEVLAGIERQPDNPFVIVGAKPGSHLVGLTRPWYRIRKKAGLEDVRLHDLRHSFASVAAASGLSLPMIGKLLGHSQPITTARYAHLASDPMLKASELVGETIGAAMQGRPKAEVVPFSPVSARLPQGKLADGSVA